MTILKKSLYNIIREEEAIFNFIEDFTLYGYWYIELENTNNIYIDQKLLNLLGFDSSFSRDKSLSTNKILKNKESERVILAIKNHFTDYSTPVKLKVAYTHKTGQEISFHCKALAVKNSENSITAVIVGNTSFVNGHEVSLEEQLNVKRLKRIIASTNIGTWEWNVQTGETIFNEKWANILGYTLEELQPISMETWEKFAHPEDHERSNKLLDEHFLGETEYYVIESRFKNKAGGWIWVKDTGKVVSWTKDGKPEWMTGSYQDITERKEHELLLEKYQDLLERSSRAAMIGTWEVDLLNNEAHWSSVTKEIHEVPEDYSPIISEAIDFYPLGINRDTLEKAVNDAIVNGVNYDIEVEIITGKGNRKWVRAIGISEFKNGTCQRLYGLFQDIQKRKEAERLNHEKQTLLETILNSIDVGIVSCDREGNLTMFNNATKEWHGLPAEPVPISEFSNYYGLFHLDGKTPLKSEEIPLLQALYTGEVSTKEFIISPKKGEKRNIVAAGSQLVGEDGNVFGAVVAMHDITKIKKTTQQLKISEAAFRGNFENAAIGMAILNESTDWLEVNDQLSRIVGYTREELLSLSVYDITPKEDIADNIAVLREFIAGTKTYLNNEQRFIHKSGSIIHVILSVSVVKNEDGKPLYFIGQITDITPRKIAAQKLQETFAKLEGILDSSTHVSIIGTDVDGTITTFNRGAENLLGYTREEMVGKESPAIIHLKKEIIKTGEELSKELNKKIENFDIFRALANNDNHDTREWTYVRKDGVSFPVQLTVTPVKDNEKIIGYLGVAAEITEIKRVEKEIKSLLAVTNDQNERLKNFAHIVSHNLRSHSGNFDMLLTLFLQDYPEASDNEIMNMLKMASDNLKETISHLNEVVLINTNIDDSLIPINIFKTTDQSIRNVAGIASEAEVEIINNIDPTLNVLGLQAYLDSIILNFLTNGIKYRSLERDSFVKIDSEIVEDYVVISIEDNGLGIDLKKHKAKIFGMYKTFHKNKDSRGIGLFITKNQIESLGGKIELESEVDKGTIFKLYLKHE
ncbi:hypothetical protein BC962_3189 [Gillisia mitskevichiae]|uniref:histidine kinase n=1 Tax=Gillisia mitskevichiae TaxID=270921 RepID=A0A495NW97_9FLAO|nr:PAS domain S-box protein [Gillisia mitskevichiae]RKS42731.1 hypothetical protein BC962_3189 [Gillisia mitskevichiae]